MSTTFTVVYDACVLYPSALRDILLQLATSDLFRARWSGQIQDEWCQALTKARPDLTEKVKLTRAKMDSSIPDCLVDGYEDLVGGLVLPDANDRHVLAAAIRCGAQIIVTKNLKDFPAEYVGRYGIEAQHPDTFIASLMTLYPNSLATVCAAARAVRCRLKKPPYAPEEYLALLEKQDLFLTAAELGLNLEALS